MPRPRILVTLADTPWPQDSGKRVRQWANLRGLAQLGDVDALVLFSSMEHPQPPPELQLHAFQSVGAPELSQLRALRRLAVGRPWSVARKPWDQVRRVIAASMSGTYDLVWFGGLDHALELREAVRAAAVVVDIDDIETEKVRAFLRLPQERSAAGLLTTVQRRVELPMWARIQSVVTDFADRVIVCSQEDAAILGSPKAAVVPNCFPGPGQLPKADRVAGSMLIIGNFAYEPNVDAARFAAREVLPLVRAQVPQACLRLVGRASHEALADLAGCPGVVVVGPVPETAAELLAAAAVLVPVRWGGGTRVKIAEAFAFGAPVVSTSLGCAGYPVASGRELLIHDDPAGFAAGCVSILSDPQLGARLAAAGRALYEQLYTPDAIAKLIREVVAPLG